MTQHCYYITASAFINKKASDIGRRTHVNFTVLSDRKGKELAVELEDATRERFNAFSEEFSGEIFNLSVDNVFDCGEVEDD